MSDTDTDDGADPDVGVTESQAIPFPVETVAENGVLEALVATATVCAAASVPPAGCAKVSAVGEGERVPPVETVSVTVTVEGVPPPAGVKVTVPI